MDNVATVPAERRMELFRESAARKSLAVDLIEKDFWVCWSLHRLFSRMADLPATLLFARKRRLLRDHSIGGRPT